MAVLIDTSALTPEVAPQGIPQDYQSIQSSPDTFGAGLGRSMMQAGSEIGGVAQFYGQVAADNATNDFMDFSTKLLHGDPNKTVTGPDGQPMQDTGYFGLHGRDALDARPAVMQKLDERMQAIRDTLTSPQQKLQFNDFTRRQRSYLDSQIGTHADNQFQTWGQTVNKATTDINLNRISANAGDQTAVDMSTQELIHARVKMAQLQGAKPGDPLYQAAIEDAKRDALGAQILTLAQTDPERAQAILKANQAVAGDKYAAWQGELNARTDRKIGMDAANRPLDYKPGVSPASAAAVGDSTADGIKTAGRLTGDTLVGRPSSNTDPAKPGVLQAIQKLPQAPAPNTPVVIGTGLMNDVGPSGDISKANVSIVADQIAAAKAKGYSPVVLGVGDKYAGLNPQIQKIAEANGARFAPLGPNDGTHATDGYKAALTAAVGASGGIKSGPAANIDPSIPPEGRALLATIGGPEAGGQYNVRYGGATFNGFDDHPRVRQMITTGPNAGKYSDAAGRYQFLSSTWDQERAKLGLTNFSPASQDKAAWDLAQTSYQKLSGRDLLSDLREGGHMSQIASALRTQWTSLPGGIEEGISSGGFSAAYNAALQVHGASTIASREPNMGGEQRAFGTPSYSPAAPGGADFGGATVQPASFSPGGGATIQNASSEYDTLSPEDIRSQKLVSIERDQTLTPTQKDYAIAEVEKQYRTAQIAAEQDAKSKKAVKDAAINDIDGYLLKGDFNGAYAALDKSDKLDNQEKLALSDTIAKRAGEDNPKEYGPKFKEMFDRVLLDHHDPAAISNIMDIYRAENAGDITSKGTAKLRQILADTTKPDEYGLQSRVQAALGAAKERLNFEQDFGTFKIRDPKGAEYMNKFTNIFFDELDKFREKHPDAQGFPLFTKQAQDELFESIRPAKQMALDKLGASAESATGPDTTPIPKAPANVDEKSWGEVAATPPRLSNGQQVPHSIWGQALTMLVSNPTPDMIKKFNDSAMAKAEGLDGQAILDKLRAGAAIGSVSPPPASSAPAAPAPAKPQSVYDQEAQSAAETRAKNWDALKEGAAKIFRGTQPPQNMTPEQRRFWYGVSGEASK